MKRNYHLLLVDDHPIITAAYKKALQAVEKQHNHIKINIVEAHNLEQADYELQKFNSKRLLDIAFIDLKLPPCPRLDLLSGEDFALRVKDRFPTTKIIIATTFNHNFRIHSIFKSINPDGFLVKNDLTEKELIQCIEDVLEEVPYYSKTVRSSLRQYVANDLLLDQVDRQILYQLSLGIKTKDLSSLIPLSSAGIDRRKKHLKEVFETEYQDDKVLLEAARELGFI
ncbi:response regulator [Mesonia sp. MT50]|uniref:Response regulator n=1 Tax=Mesonia profundi TaxID=3070998 RepID=A0ABU1A3H6_9FLAO|nr:response regulator [Mesonia profundi]MDQ7918262.1 response regulator [Mesonia profundi]